MQKIARHPRQPVISDKYGISRYKHNAIIQLLLDKGPFDLNKLAVMGFSDEDHEQLAQLIGYSVSGACDLSYMSDRICNQALNDTHFIRKEENEEDNTDNHTTDGATASAS